MNYKIISKNGVFLSVPEPTQADLREIYDKSHEVCPSCHSSNITTTCMGRFFNYTLTVDGKIHVIGEDSNYVSCNCGWKGRAYELIPRIENESL